MSKYSYVDAYLDATEFAIFVSKLMKKKTKIYSVELGKIGVSE
jgi:hypothetical protein